MKSLVKRLFRTISNAFCDQFYRKDPYLNVINLVWRNAREESARFIQDNLSQALLFELRSGIWDYVVDVMPEDGLVLEFGVFRARSINHFSDRMTAKVDSRSLHGFDSFEGIEEDWAGHFRPSGSYTLDKKLPDVRDNVQLYAGWVQDTVPPFLKEKDGPIAFMHIDTDTYTPCQFLLENTFHRWALGTVILFDELHGYPGWPYGEYKALREFSDKHPDVTYEYIAFSDKQAAIRVTGLPNLE